ncbi:MAG: FAD-linked oxidase C-terminal domain-containing protein [Dysgonomonas sp.]
MAIKDLFKRLQYHDAVLFGHALEGNLHLNFSQDFLNSIGSCQICATHG